MTSTSSSDFEVMLRGPIRATGGSCGILAPHDNELAARVAGLPKSAPAVRCRDRGLRAGSGLVDEGVAGAHRQRRAGARPSRRLDHRLRWRGGPVRLVSMPVLRRPLSLDALGGEPVLGRVPPLRVPEVARPARGAGVRAALTMAAVELLGSARDRSSDNVRHERRSGPAAPSAPAPSSRSAGVSERGAGRSSPAATSRRALRRSRRPRCPRG